MEFSEISEFIEQEDARLNKFYSNHCDREKMILARTVKLSEEFGELCEEILAHNGFQRKQKLENHNKENLPEEFADVLITTLLVAKSMNVDVAKALESKIEKIRKRTY